MEHALRCNSLKCRTQLGDQAVVTTCSHVFCVPCSDTLGLSNPHGSERLCPACQTELPNPDDAVVAQLNPSEDYKTSVLSGLGPTVILECAGRALSFFSYQMTQEIVYQEYLARSLTEKYSALNSHVEKLVKDANVQITEMGGKLEAMHLEYKKLEDKNERLQNAYREKAKKHQETQKLYNQLKQHQLAGTLEQAADSDAEHTLQNAAAAPHNDVGFRGGPVGQRQGRPGNGGNDDRSNNPQPPQAYSHAPNPRAGLHTSQSAPVPATPSGHRQQLPRPLYGNPNIANSVRHEGPRNGTPQRQQLFNVFNPNVMGLKGNSPRVGGMSQGMRVSRPQNIPYHGAVNYR